MKYAFSSAGLALLRKYGSRNALLAFDFDGTLAPVVARPEQAGVRASTRELLEHLSQVAPVAAVTGRSLKNVRALLPPTLSAWAGNHGAEVFPRKAGKGSVLLSTRKKVQAWSKQLREELLGYRGVFVEEKELSVCVHYRESEQRSASRRLIMNAVSRLQPGPRILGGKCVVNLLAPELPHKGQAVQSLLDSFGLLSAVYVGDDENDEDVFALADPRVCSIRIGKRPHSRAALYLKRQGEIDRLLRFLLSLRAPSSSRYRKRREDQAPRNRH